MSGVCEVPVHLLHKFLYVTFADYFHNCSYRRTYFASRLVYGPVKES
jgi:hypothetical protein